jgi:hypothetical protein
MPATDMDRIKKGVEYIYTFLKDGDTHCPLCDADMGVTEKLGTSLKNHIRNMHPLRAVDCWEQGTLTPKEEEPPIDMTAPIGEVVGIKTQDQYDRYDALHIPTKVRERSVEVGSSLSWKAPDRLARAIDMGAQVVRREGEAGVKQQSTEDSKLKTAEMTLVEWPAVVNAARRQQKKSRIDNQLASRKEELQKVQGETEKLIYDEMRRRGQDKTVSLQVARAVAGNADTSFEKGDPRRHEGIEVSRG